MKLNCNIYNPEKSISEGIFYSSYFGVGFSRYENMVAYIDLCEKVMVVCVGVYMPLI